LTLSGECPPVFERLNFLLLPSLVLAATNIATFSRFMRTSMLDVMGQDYIRTARAKGLPNNTVWFRHGARNALIPLATLIGQTIPVIIGGAVVTEQIFSWPGVGRAAVDAVIEQDYPVIMTVVIFASISTIVGFLISDILYALIDPRVRLE
jgi:peptide/nickel transport system permease protein